MELILDNGNSVYQIKSYYAKILNINHQLYEQSLLISATQLLSPWGPENLQQLQVSHMAPVLAWKPQIFILGTGEKFSSPGLSVFEPLMKHRIGFEIMDTAAACRTFTLLVAEGRNVVAGLLV